MVYSYTLESSSQHESKYLYGYMGWILCSSLYSSFIMNVKSDLTNKTLEVLATMPDSYLYSLSMRAFARIPYDIIVMTLTFFYLSLFIGYEESLIKLYLNVILFYIFFIPFVVACSLACSCLVLFFKKAEVLIVFGNMFIGFAVYMAVLNYDKFKIAASSLTLTLLFFLSLLLLLISMLFFTKIYLSLLRLGILKEL